MTRREMRIRIMKSIYQYLLTERTIDDILEENIDIDDKTSISFIVDTTVGTINNLDELIEEISPKLHDYKFDRLGFVEQAILLMSLYQLRNTDIDRPVVINEAIEIAKKFCDDDAPKFINGVLDQL